ncbi:MAG: response regulator transcription factor [Bacillota bacterium]|nr:response regulator transcription factor [Bacillota bacterium]
MFNIMVIEDDKKLGRLIQESLERYGFPVFCIEDFKNIESSFEKLAPDLVILDITLPYYDGFYLCRVFRRKSKLPLLIISARNSSAEQLLGLELGADDYITKPFDIEILIAKVKAALRRAYGEYSDGVEEKRILCVKGLSLDEGSFRLSYKDMTAELSKNEIKILRKFLETPDKIISREELLTELWDDSAFVDDNTLTVNVTRVKRKLEQMGIENAVRTIRGVGYLFDSSSMEELQDE